MKKTHLWLFVLSVLCVAFATVGCGHEHAYTEQVTDAAFLASEASCLSPASYYYSCICGEKGDSTFSYGDKTEHRIENGVCNGCGLPESSEKLTFVWDEETQSYTLTYINNDCRDITVGLYNGYPVTRIAKNAFRNRQRFTSVTLGACVTEIDDGTFYGCASLEHITVSENNPVYAAAGDCLIDRKAGILIAGCKNSVFPSDQNIKEIADYAFYGVQGLEEFRISDSVERIGDYAFSGCTDLKKLTVGNGIKDIGEKALDGCTALAYNVYDNVNYLGNLYNSFVICIGAVDKTLTSYELHPDTRILGDAAFLNCQKAERITVYGNLVNIGEASFSGCYALQYSIYKGGAYLGNDENPYLLFADQEERYMIPCKEIHPDTRIIYSNALSNNSVQELIIPKNVTLICDYGLSKLHAESITVENGNEFYRAQGNCLIEIETKTLIYGCKNSIIPSDGSVTRIGVSAFSGSAPDTLIIPNTVTHIEEDAFFSATVKNITLPESIVYIGEYAFASSKLESITFLGNGIDTIRDCTFRYCNALNSITLPDSVQSIGARAFENSALESITLPASLRSIGEKAFSSCGSLRYVIFPEGMSSFATEDFSYHAPILVLPTSISWISTSSSATSNFSGIIFYCGTAAEWKEITIHPEIVPGLGRPYYYSETAPTEEGYYWHYDEAGRPTSW